MFKKIVIFVILGILTVQASAKGVGYIERNAGEGFIDELLLSDVPKPPNECDGLKGHLAMRNLTDYRHKRSYDKIYGCWKLSDDKRSVIFVYQRDDGEWQRRNFDVDDIQLL